MIEKTATNINGLFVLSNKIFSDKRGDFKKVFTASDFNTLNIDVEFKELYYSINKKNVIRGMHFQIPPEDHIKLVYCVQGSITDVCLDIRKNSKTYGSYFSIDLSGKSDTFLYIPQGIAHGFASREDNTIVHYAQTTCYSKEHDCGIHYNSFGYNWQIDNPIVSDRDRAFLPIDAYEDAYEVS